MGYPSEGVNSAANNDAAKAIEFGFLGVNFTANLLLTGLIGQFFLLDKDYCWAIVRI